MSRSDFSLIWVPSVLRSPPRRDTDSITPGGDSYPRSVRFSVEMTEAITSPLGSASDPEIPAIGASARRTQGEPTSRRRARAKLATTSGGPGQAGPTTVTRRCWIRRRLGVPIVASGVRIGTRYSCHPLGFPSF